MQAISEEREQKILDKADQEAQRYLHKYRRHVEGLENDSLIKVVNGEVTSYDIANLGTLLERWDDYRDFCEEAGTLSNLGQIPNIAHDIISVSYGTNPISTIASVQPVEEERGMVYFKQIETGIARPGVPAGSLLQAPDRSQTHFPGAGDQAYAGDRVKGGTATTVLNTLTYTITVPAHSRPLRPFKVEVIADLANQGGSIPDVVTLKDMEGDGVLWASDGSKGTVDYTTGAISITFPTGYITAAGDTITAWVYTDFESQDDIPSIVMKLTSKSVDTEVMALKSTVGLAQSFTLKKRFGQSALDDMATDLVSEINSEIARKLISELATNAVSNEDWSRAKPAGISFADHKMTFMDSLFVAESNMLNNAGRGQISTMVAGRKACEIIGTLDGFTKISDGAVKNTHIFGTLRGITVVRVIHNTVLNENTVLCVYKGPTPWEAAAVYSPFMPLVVTSAMPNGVNPLVNQQAAAIQAATTCVVPNFVTKLTVTA